jgi:adenylate kinase family enzyme
MSKIFVSGPSGVGKTTLGHILEKKYGWHHVDCEKMHLLKNMTWLEDPLAFIPEKENTVLTWGLVLSTFSAAEKIIDSGFTYIWLDGSKEYIQRSLKERGETESFIAHPQRKQALEILQKKQPDMIINAFDDYGFRLDTATIIHERYWT